MTAGANPTATGEGGGGTSGSFWHTYGTSLVPGGYAILAIVAWWMSPSAAGVGAIELACAVGLGALAIALVVMRLGVGNRQDYFGGLALIGIGLFALWASRDLPGMRGFAFGPGTAPRGFAIILVLLGVGIGLGGLFTKGPDVEKFGIRGPLLIVASTFVFALSIRPRGLVFASFVSIVVSAFATTEVRWLETVIWAAVLTLFCALLFPWGLNLPLQLWPNGFDPMHLLHLR
jgi:putative tricarboxylic transport membrane protein